MNPEDRGVEGTQRNPSLEEILRRWPAVSLESELLEELRRLEDHRNQLHGTVRKLESRVRDQSFQARYRGVELEALHDVGLAIGSILDPVEVAEQILLRAISLLDARQGALFDVVPNEEDETPTLVPVRVMGELAESSTLSSTLVRALAEPSDLFNGALHALAQTITIDGEVLGVLVVADKESRRGVGPFTAGDSRTLALFAQQGAVALRNARHHRQALERERIDRDMVLAARIQRQLLPDALPAVEGYRLTAWSRPAREVGGDHYAVRQLPGGRLLLVVADVSGKGVPAALLVSNLDSALQLMLASTPPRDAAPLNAELLERLSQHIFERSLANQFITLLAACLDPSTGRLDFVNAGHNPGLLRQRGDSFQLLPASGPPLGMFPAVNYRLETRRLAPGDLLCLYTDGISECADDDEQELEEAGLRQLLDDGLRGEQHPSALERLAEIVAQQCRERVGDRPQEDDQTLLLLRRRPNVDSDADSRRKA